MIVIDLLCNVVTLLLGVIIIAPLILTLMSLQSGKKTVKAVLWVSADGLRVVDDKTKVSKTPLFLT